MKLLLLGASGRTGRHVLRCALEAGHHVVALVRHPEKMAAGSQRLTIACGTPEKLGDIASALTGCEAVISTLNNNRSSDLPWAKPVSPPMFMTRSIAHTIDAMRAGGLRRIIVVSAVGVGDSFAEAPLVTRILIRQTNLRVVFADHQAQEALLRKSGLNWTCVRAAILTNCAPTKSLIVSLEGRPKPALTIGRPRVASFLVDILAWADFFGKTPVISERRWPL
jgi:uncharacterized protein YbjT (DUF2867 family)